MTGCSRHGYAVLDIETMPCPDALSLSPDGGNGHRRIALHRLASVAVISGTYEDAAFTGTDIRVFTSEEHDEVAMLSFVDHLLPDPFDPSARVITYNGNEHDLPLLRLRAGANWCHSLTNLTAWTEPRRRGRIDLISEGFGSSGARWRLTDLCAGLGFTTRHGLIAQSVLSLISRERWDAVAEHNMMDAVGTFLAYASHLSLEANSHRPLASAWVELARLLEGTDSVNKGSRPIWHHHFVDRARRVMKD